MHITERILPCDYEIFFIMLNLQIQIVSKLLGKTSVFDLSSKLLCCGEILQCSLQESTGFDCKWPEHDLHMPSKQKVGNWKIAFVNVFSSVI